VDPIARALCADHNYLTHLCPRGRCGRSLPHCHTVLSHKHGIEFWRIEHEIEFCADSPPWRHPSGKWMVSLVNSHTNATRIGWHMWEIDLRFAPVVYPEWLTWLGTWAGGKVESGGPSVRRSLGRYVPMSTKRSARKVDIRLPGSASQIHDDATTACMPRVGPYSSPMPRDLW